MSRGGLFTSPPSYLTISRDFSFACIYVCASGYVSKPVFIYSTLLHVWRADLEINRKSWKMVFFPPRSLSKDRDLKGLRGRFKPATDICLRTGVLACGSHTLTRYWHSHTFMNNTSSRCIPSEEINLQPRREKVAWEDKKRSWRMSWGEEG